MKFLKVIWITLQKHSQRDFYWNFQKTRAVVNIFNQNRMEEAEYCFETFNMWNISVAIAKNSKIATRRNLLLKLKIYFWYYCRKWKMMKRKQNVLELKKNLNYVCKFKNENQIWKFWNKAWNQLLIDFEIKIGTKLTNKIKEDDKLESNLKLTIKANLNTK